jgi:uncharacterized protein YbaR (Trm112 family)
MHIELTEMLRCPGPHQESFLVMSTGEMSGRMVRSGVLGCPTCRKEYPIVKGVVEFSGSGKGETGNGGAPSATFPVSRFPFPAVDPQTLQALLDLSGPGGYVVLVGSAARHAVGLAGLMGGIHFVGINAPAGVEELPILSLLRCEALIPLRHAMARSVVVGPDVADAAWLAEASRVLLRGRRLVIEGELGTPPAGVAKRAAGEGLWVGDKA